jgi:hypothetical protein
MAYLVSCLLPPASGLPHLVIIPLREDFVAKDKSPKKETKKPKKKK